MDFRDGDVLLTYGKGGFWPPRRLFLWVVYRAIREYQKAKWRRNYRATHCRVFLDGQFFEATAPVCRWVTLGELALEKKDWNVVRWAGVAYGSEYVLNVPAMLTVAEKLIGTPYDKGDLIDFGLAGLLGWSTKYIRIFGDRAKKYRVCSTAAAAVVYAGGARLFYEGEELSPDATDPAAFENQPAHLWQIMEGE